MNVKIIHILPAFVSILLGHTLSAAAIAEPAEERRGSAGSGYQLPLLQTAFEAVSKMPTDPHIRNRAKARERIVSACLEIEAPGEAVRYADKISTWRRGAAYADIALYYARKGDLEASRRELAKAEQLVENCELIHSGDVIATGEYRLLGESLGEWRLDRVKAHISRTYAYLRQTDDAARWSDGISEDETPKISALKASVCDAGEYAETRDALIRLAETEQFEAVKQALLGLCGLYDRFYSDVRKRSELDKAITLYKADMPRFMQIEILTEMAKAALNNNDMETGLSLTRDAEEKLESATYRPRLYFPMKATIVSLTFRSGDTTAALEGLNTMGQAYDRQRNEIIDIYRAAILCRIAEANAVSGKSEQAQALYRRAADEAVINANSRPRADDLSEICRSMAIFEVEPAPALFNALEEIDNKLGKPW